MQGADQAVLPLNGSGGDSGHDDSQGSLVRLASALRVFSRTVGAATRAQARYRGRDATESVTLVVDGSGRVESVDIDQDWFGGRRAAGLGAALFEAYRAAMTEVLTAGVNRMTEAQQQESAGCGPHGAYPPGQPTTRSPLSDTFHPPTFDDVRTALRRLEERQYEREYRRERRLAERPADDRVLHGPHGIVQVTVRDGDVRDIALLRQITRSEVNVLAHDTVMALRALRSGNDRDAARHHAKRV